MLPVQIDQVYKIVAFQDQSLCISLNDDKITSPLVMKPFANKESQLWRLIKTRHETYQIQSVQADYYVMFHKLESSEPVRTELFSPSDNTTNR